VSRRQWIAALGVSLAIVSVAAAQRNPYIGFVYPAGGQQGTTFQVRLGGQRLEGLEGAIVSGPGVRARLVDYRKRLSNQDRRFLQEQLKDLRKKQKKAPAKGRKPAAKDAPAMMQMMGQEMMGQEMMGAEMMGAGKLAKSGKPAGKSGAGASLVQRIQTRLSEYCNRPADASLADIAIVEVTIAPNAAPGARDIRLVTYRGLSNPLVFHVGQFPEVARKPMKTQPFQVLGKEALAQRKRPPEEEEVRIEVPCALNGQVASGEVNRYRFKARKGQRLVISVAARELIPYIADAVPGWFQPLLTLCDADGNEVAFNDDYRFRPDPVILHEVAREGEYVLSITDAIYRGREDFVYRISLGESPFVTSIFPLGARAGKPVPVKMKGWNLGKARLRLPPQTAGAGPYRIAADRRDLVSNRVPFALDNLPECREKEGNNDAKLAQKVSLPIIVNGRMNTPGDSDLFQVEGKAGQTLVAEVHARRLGSPLDSVLQCADAKGRIIAANDDHGDPGSGLNTHHADSYLRVKLPADGAYFVRLSDAERKCGDAYAYRLRISPPLPDFELRIVPSCVSMRGKGSGFVDVYAIRKDGFGGPIKLALADPPDGFSSSGTTLQAGKEKARLTVKTTVAKNNEPVTLRVKGTARIGKRDVEHIATPAEDRMQAFLWRHLVPAESLVALIYDPKYKAESKRPLPPTPEKKEDVDPDKPPAKAKFSKKQVVGLMRQLKRLHGQWLLTDEFYLKKVAECEAAL
jgi:hypothetical protein